MVSLLLSKQKTLIDLTDLSLQTPLHLAAENSSLDVVRVLVKEGAKVDLGDSEGCTALHLSCRSMRYRRATEADESIVKLLADNTKVINHMYKEGYTALDWAIDVYEDNLVKILLDCKADPDINNNDGGWSILRRASYRGNVNVVEMLLRDGAEHVAAIDYASKDNWTAVHQACDEGEVEVVEILLKKKADTTIRIKGTGEIPLHLAARNGHEKVVRLLLDPDLNPNNADKDVTATTANDETALHLAAGNGYYSVVNDLLDAGSDFTATTTEDETALHIAARKGYDLVVNVLLDAGSDVTTTTGDD